MTSIINLYRIFNHFIQQYLPKNIMIRQKEKQSLEMEIKPQQYANKNTKILGNHFIYGKLEPNQKWNDPRIKVLPPNYFKGKNVIDIGCNEGILSIPIAIKYQPKMVHAIDIDPQMIKRTKNNIQLFVQKNQHYKYPKHIIEDITTLPQFFKQKLSKRFGQKVLQFDSNYEIRPQNTNPDHIFPKNIIAYSQNIMSPLEIDKFDCILCMNVTKWIHLAYGDTGIKKLFQNIEGMSDDGTILILQTQPWTSYRKKKNLFPQYAQNYRMILQKPQRFKDYLRKLGFQLIQTIVPSEQNALKHEILILQKRKCIA